MVIGVGHNGRTESVGALVCEQFINFLPSFNQSEYINHYVINCIIKFIMSHKHNITSKEIEEYMKFGSLFIVHGRQQYYLLELAPTDENSTKSHNRTQPGFLISN